MLCHLCCESGTSRCKYTTDRDKASYSLQATNFYLNTLWDTLTIKCEMDLTIVFHTKPSTCQALFSRPATVTRNPILMC